MTLDEWSGNIRFLCFSLLRCMVECISWDGRNVVCSSLLFNTILRLVEQNVMFVFLSSGPTYLEGGHLSPTPRFSNQGQIMLTTTLITTCLPDFQTFRWLCSWDWTEVLLGFWIHGGSKFSVLLQTKLFYSSCFLVLRFWRGFKPSKPSK